MRRATIVAVAILIALGAAESQQRGPRAPRSCHRSYPDFCIPAPPPDLDCRDIPRRQRPFRVRQPDPHRFDRDKDGWGCE